jgi:hypothetical protein
VCRGIHRPAAFASAVVVGLVPEGAKPTVRLGISLKICLTVGETGKRSFTPVRPSKAVGAMTIRSIVHAYFYT